MLSKPALANAQWPICYDYAVEEGCYKRDPATGKEVENNGFVNECMSHTSVAATDTCIFHSKFGRLSSINCYHSEPWTGTVTSQDKMQAGSSDAVQLKAKHVRR